MVSIPQAFGTTAQWEVPIGGSLDAVNKGLRKPLSVADRDAIHYMFTTNDIVYALKQQRLQTLLIHQMTLLREGHDLSDRATFVVDNYWKKFASDLFGFVLERGYFAWRVIDVAIRVPSETLPKFSEGGPENEGGPGPHEMWRQTRKGPRDRPVVYETVMVQVPVVPTYGTYLEYIELDDQKNGVLVFSSMDSLEEDLSIKYTKSKVYDFPDWYSATYRSEGMAILREYRRLLDDENRQSALDSELAIPRVFVEKRPLNDTGASQALTAEETLTLEDYEVNASGYPQKRSVPVVLSAGASTAKLADKLRKGLPIEPTERTVKLPDGYQMSNAGKEAKMTISILDRQRAFAERAARAALMPTDFASGENRGIMNVSGQAMELDMQQMLNRMREVRDDLDSVLDMVRVSINGEQDTSSKFHIGLITVGNHDRNRELFEHNVLNEEMFLRESLKGMNVELDKLPKSLRGGFKPLRRFQRSIDEEDQVRREEQEHAMQMAREEHERALQLKEIEHVHAVELAKITKAEKPAKKRKTSK